MKEQKRLKDEVIAGMMQRHGYTREQAESAWEDFRLQIYARRLLRNVKKIDVERN